MDDSIFDTFSDLLIYDIRGSNVDEALEILNTYNILTYDILEKVIESIINHLSSIVELSDLDTQDGKYYVVQLLLDQLMIKNPWYYGNIVEIGFEKIDEKFKSLGQEIEHPKGLLKLGSIPKDEYLSFLDEKATRLKNFLIYFKDNHQRTQEWLANALHPETYFVKTLGRNFNRLANSSFGKKRRTKKRKSVGYYFPRNNSTRYNQVFLRNKTYVNYRGKKVTGRIYKTKNQLNREIKRRNKI